MSTSPKPKIPSILKKSNAKAEDILAPSDPNDSDDAPQQSKLPADEDDLSEDITVSGLGKPSSVKRFKPNMKNQGTKENAGGVKKTSLNTVKAKEFKAGGAKKEIEDDIEEEEQEDKEEKSKIASKKGQKKGKKNTDNTDNMEDESTVKEQAGSGDEGDGSPKKGNRKVVAPKKSKDEKRESSVGEKKKVVGGKKEEVKKEEEPVKEKEETIKEKGKKNLLTVKGTAGKGLLGKKSADKSATKEDKEDKVEKSDSEEKKEEKEGETKKAEPLIKREKKKLLLPSGLNKAKEKEDDKDKKSDKKIGKKGEKSDKDKKDKKEGEKKDKKAKKEKKEKKPKKEKKTKKKKEDEPEEAEASDEEEDDDDLGESELSKLYDDDEEEEESGDERDVMILAGVYGDEDDQDKIKDEYDEDGQLQIASSKGGEAEVDSYWKKNTRRSKGSSNKRKASNMTSPQPHDGERSLKMTKTSKKVFMFSGLEEDDRGMLYTTVAKLAGFDIDTSSNAYMTHLIYSGTKRTMKLLFAIAKRAWILVPSFLYSSLEFGDWVPEKEHEFGGVPNKNFRDAYGPLLKDLRFHFNHGDLEFFETVSIVDLKILVKLAGGKLVDKPDEADVIIEDKQNKKNSLNTRKFEGNKPHIISFKWILDSLMKYAKLNYQEYEILMCYV